MFRNFLIFVGFAFAACTANATPVPFGEYRLVSGSAIWDLKGTVTEYYANLGEISDAPKVGDTGVVHVTSDFTGYIDNTFLTFGYTDYSYNFSNGWSASSNGPNQVDQATVCGYAMNFCMGTLGGPGFEVAESLVTFYFDIAEELGVPNNGAPLLVKFIETVILVSRSNSDDFHYFTVNGTQSFAKGYSVVPLPASGALLGLAFLTLFGLRKKAMPA
ncbi:MAG: hypothetical protein ACOH2M_07505 [Cypionkella sp.]